MPVYFHLLDLSKYAFIFGFAFAITYCLIPLFIRLAPKLGMVDVPDARRVHTRPTPRGGGVAVWIAFHCAMLLYFYLDPPGNGSLNYQWWQAFLISSTILLVIGLIDDAFGVRPLFKLAGQTLAAVAMWYFSGSEFSRLLGFELPYALDVLITIAWYLAFINAFNLIDGLDGLCSGLAMIGAIGLGLSYIITRDSVDMMVTLALAGACLAFLRYNFHPASVFLGDTGSMFLGFALASFALETGSKSTVVVTLGVALLSGGIPLFDTCLAIWRRSVRKLLAGDGKVMGADKDHLHHRLLASGISTRKVALILYAGSALLVSTGLISLLVTKAALGLYAITVVLAIYVIIRHVAHIELWDTGMAINRGLVKPRPKSLATICYVIWDITAIALALAIAFYLVPIPVIDKSIGTKEEWIRSLPLWIMPMFLALVMTKTYRRVWSKSGVQDFVSLQFAIIIGWVITFSSQVIALNGWDRIMLARAVIFGGVVYAMVVFARSFNLLLRVLMRFILKSKPQNISLHNVLLYGVTDRGLLYMRSEERSINVAGKNIHICGLIDDDTNFRKRYVKSCPVLGTLDDLPAIVATYCVDEVVVACDLNEERRVQLLQLAREHKLKVSEWVFDSHVLAEAPLKTEAGVANAETTDASLLSDKREATI